MSPFFPPAGLDFEAWTSKFRSAATGGGPDYLRSPRCFVELEGDSRLRRLRFDDSPAAYRLWSFLLSENDRLAAARRSGTKIVGVMKDLGTASILAYAAPRTLAFYPDGAWWIPCVMEMSEGLLRIAEAEGFGDDVCPVRAALAAFLNRAHFPIPDLLVAAVGACCDDMSGVMQRLADLKIPLVWWELPYRRGEATPELIRFVAGQLQEIRRAIGDLSGCVLTDEMLAATIRKANLVRRRLARIRDLAYGSIPAPFPALETQICEMLAIHFCSDLDECLEVLGDVLRLIESRAASGQGVLSPEACRVVWVNPVADLRAMNVFEDAGGALAGTEYLFRHALTPIPEDRPPMEALAETVLGDPMIGTAEFRARIVIEEAERRGAEGVIISAIPGASHSATEGLIIHQEVQKALGLPVLDIMIPPLVDASSSQVGTRLESFFEIIRARRGHA